MNNDKDINEFLDTIFKNATQEDIEKFLNKLLEVQKILTDLETNNNDILKDIKERV